MPLLLALVAGLVVSAQALVALKIFGGSSLSWTSVALLAQAGPLLFLAMVGVGAAREWRRVVRGRSEP